MVGESLGILTRVSASFRVWESFSNTKEKFSGLSRVELKNHESRLVKFSK